MAELLLKSIPVPAPYAAKGSNEKMLIKKKRAGVVKVNFIFFIAGDP